MVALVGASGAGKTTLLNTLSQRQKVGVVTGDMLVDGRPLDTEFQRGSKSPISWSFFFFFASHFLRVLYSLARRWGEKLIIHCLNFQLYPLKAILIKYPAF